MGYGKGTGKQELILDAEIFNGAAATKIFKAMIGNNIVKPIPIGVESLQITSIDELVAMYRTAEALDLRYAFKGKDLRNTILEAIKKKPISFKLFKKLIEESYFDQHLSTMIKNDVMDGAVKGGDRISSDFKLVKQYCIMHNAQYGLWDEMKEIRSKIEAKLGVNKTKKGMGGSTKSNVGGVMAPQVGDQSEFPALPCKR